MDPTSRLRIATRIHFALLRHFNEDVSVRTLLDNSADTREVLWVFEASGVPELIALAAQFEQASAAYAQTLQRARLGDGSGGSPQDAGWTQNTSGFGVSRPPEFGDPPLGPTASSSSASPMSWLRRHTARSVR